MAAAVGSLRSCPRRLLLLLCTAAIFGGGISIKQKLYCGPQKYETPSTYAANLDLLLSELPVDTMTKSDDTGFRIGNVPHGDRDDVPDKVGVLAMCYADCTWDECAQCLRAAVALVREGEDCPNARNASVFYDACLLIYYPLPSPWILPYVPVTVEDDRRLEFDLAGSDAATSFQRERDRLLRDLSDLAVSSKLYAAAGSAKYGSGGAAGTIYGLVQCVGSMSGQECSSCLDTMSQLVDDDPTLALAYKTVVMLKGYWCYIRYEPQYFDVYISSSGVASPPSASATAPAAAVTPLPPPPNQGRSRKATRNAVIIAGGSITLVVCAGIIVLLGCLFRGRMFRLLRSEPRRKSIQLSSSTAREFSPSQLKAATNNFSRSLGCGAFGVVYKGTLGEKEVAVKKLHNKDGDGDFAKEAGILMAFKHKNLVKLLGYCDRGEDRLLCFEYLSGGDNLIYAKGATARVVLSQGSAAGGRGGLDWTGCYRIVEGVCSGLNYLHHELYHEQRIVHMDLKASNVLISRGEGGDVTSVKIADFGLSRFFKAGLSRSYTEQVVGLKAYMAPEYRNSGRISTKVDIYSFGVLILEIVTGLCATVNGSSDDFINWVRSEGSKGDVRNLMDPSLRDCPDDCISQARNCIEIALECIEEDPDRRPDAAEIRQRLLSQSQVRRRGGE